MKIKLSKSQWEKIGNDSGWIRQSQYNGVNSTIIKLSDLRNKAESLKAELESFDWGQDYKKIKENKDFWKSMIDARKNFSNLTYHLHVAIEEARRSL